MTRATPHWFRKIIHIDMDAFFSAIEQRDRPELRGKPVVVGGNPLGRGVVATASYEARKFGIHSAMPSAQARRNCPEAIFLAGDHAKYRQVSEILHGILGKYTSQVESAGLDEAYLDVTENYLRMENPEALASVIKQNIKAVTQLTASAGVAPNKLMAKIASDMNKPDGLTVIHPASVEEFLRPLPIRKIPGVGPVTEKELNGLGIHTCGDLAKWEQAELIRHFGKWGVGLYERARGIDNEPLVLEWEPKQISNEETFEQDLVDLAAMQAVIESLATDVEHRLRKRNGRARTITLKVKYADFTLITRSRTLQRTFDDKGTMAIEAMHLLRCKTEAGKRPIRLLGVGVSAFDHPEEEPELPLGYFRDTRRNPN